MKPEVKILYEDNHILVVRKPPGLPVQSDTTGDICLIDVIKEDLKTRYEKPGNVYLGLVHRLDRPVGGLMILARTSKAMTRLSETMRERNIVKEYLAVVSGTAPLPPKGELVHYLKKNSKTNKSSVYKNPMADTREARLDYEYITSSSHYHLLKIRLHTGRHHQIRAQLSFCGWPIKGDIKYGARRTNPGPYLHLHSWHLKFPHPVRKEDMEFYDVPDSSDPVWKFFMEEIKKLNNFSNNSNRLK